MYNFVGIKIILLSKIHFFYINTDTSWKIRPKTEETGEFLNLGVFPCIDSYVYSGRNDKIQNSFPRNSRGYM